MRKAGQTEGITVDDTMVEKEGKNLNYAQGFLTMQRITAPIISMDTV